MNNYLLTNLTNLANKMGESRGLSIASRTYPIGISEGNGYHKSLNKSR